METLFSLYGSIPYRINKSELLLGLATSGHHSVSILSKEALIYATKINGALEGWVLAPGVNPHPIPFLYLMNSGTSSDRRWVTNDARYGLIAPTLVQGIFFTIYATDDGTSCEISISSPQVDYGRVRLGGLVYPDNGGSGATFPINAEVNELSRIIISRNPTALFSGPVAVRGFLPMIGGTLSTDTTKHAGYPGSGVVIYHNSSALFPFGMNLANPIPATWTAGAWEVGTYDAGGIWTAAESLPAEVYTFYQLGTLTPTQIQTAQHGLKPYINVDVTRAPIHWPSMMREGCLIDANYPTGPAAETTRLISK
jgi:hypothetical protein